MPLRLHQWNQDRVIDTPNGSNDSHTEGKCLHAITPLVTTGGNFASILFTTRIAHQMGLSVDRQAFDHVAPVCDLLSFSNETRQKMRQELFRKQHLSCLNKIPRSNPAYINPACQLRAIEDDLVATWRDYAIHQFGHLSTKNVIDCK